MIKNSLTDFTFQSINQKGVVEQIIENFKQSLIKGELKPGQRLPSELELSQQLGVGRSAVREAMKVLQALGVIHIRQGDGTYIVEGTTATTLSPLVFAIMLESSLGNDLFELRRLIEVGYCELATQNAKEADWQRIETAAAALESYVLQPTFDYQVLTELDLHFHYAVIDATHNPLVIRISRTVEELFFVSVHKTYLARWNNTEWAIKSHRSIMAAMREKNSEAIRSAIDSSLIYWKEELTANDEDEQEN